MNGSFYGLTQKEHETEYEFCLRCCLAKHNKEIDADWSEIVEHFDLLENVHRDTLRKNFVGKMGVGYVVEFYENKIAQMSINNEPKEVQDDILLELESKAQDLKKERYKINDERRRLNELLRTEARWENLVDYLRNTIESYEYAESDYILHKRYEGGNIQASLLLSDWHIGSEFRTFHNTFNLDIAKARAERLKQDVLAYCNLHSVDTLHIEMLGDLISGNIHLTGRLSNNENVIEQVVEASELLAKFIYEISLEVPNVKLVYCIGNHGRVSANVKESISEENFEYLIRWHLEARLKDVKNIQWIPNVIDREIAAYQIGNRTIACCHGHREKNYKDSVKTLSQYLEYVKVDEVHMGHFHNHQVINNVIVNGSFMGTDKYAQELRYNSVPSQTLRVYDEKGNFITYEINLA